MKAIDFLERLAIIIFSIGLFAYIVISAKLWASEFQVWFFRIGDLQSFVILSIAIYIFAKALEKFLKWEVNYVFPHRRRK